MALKGVNRKVADLHDLFGDNNRQPRNKDIRDVIQSLSTLTTQVVTLTTATNSSYSVSSQDGMVRCDATSGAFTVNLPDAQSVPIGQSIVFKKVDSSANAVTLSGVGGQKMDGASTLALSSQYATKRLMSTGTGWDVVLS
ncbi:hypothetical protein [Paraburkholderia kururiensis]|uniref:hypothetical protein n=1 Tax=Paraburkholderia kururiensis TaxID=984307 RepID=UPI000347CC90|nr:hypothetical protein [Paraburkholderia kururiensis]